MATQIDLKTQKKFEKSEKIEKNNFAKKKEANTQEISRRARNAPRGQTRAMSMAKPLTKTAKFANLKSKSIIPEKQGLNKPKKPKLRSFGFISDVTAWVKKNRLPRKSKIFVISGGYNEIRKALQRRGWIMNPDYFSLCYHLKFTLRGSHINYGSLKPYQIVNHFEKVSVLTTKIGLCRTLRKLTFFKNLTADSFFPMCFDCNEETEFKSFLTYFKLTKAESLLKEFLELARENKREAKRYKEIEGEPLEAALKVSKRRLMDLGSLLDSGEKDWKGITEEEWELIAGEDVSENAIKQVLHEKSMKRYEKLDKKAKKKKKRRKKKKKKRKKKMETEESEDEEEDEEEGVELSDKEKEVRRVLRRLQRRFPQTKMNGKENIWIVKPSGLSRGRGIQLFNSYAEIMHHVNTRDFSWVIQKYMENPLLYKGKKLDIRQWVLVTNWNPLTIWFYQECYIRVSTAAYTLKNIKDR